VLSIFSYDIENQLLLIGRSFLDLYSLELLLFVIEARGNLRSEERQTRLDLLHYDLIEVSAEIRDAASLGHCLVVLFGLEE
jgi:hypothetical protein